jgi:hypothetical protein
MDCDKAGMFMVHSPCDCMVGLFPGDFVVILADDVNIGGGKGERIASRIVRHSEQFSILAPHCAKAIGMSGLDSAVAWVFGLCFGSHRFSLRQLLDSGLASMFTVRLTSRTMGRFVKEFMAERG